VRRGLAENDWGLCRGKAEMQDDGASEPALVDWLHEAIQRSAGREPGDPPLTFADLWRSPRFGRPMAPPGTDGYAPPPLNPAIALYMFSTNLSHGRPVRWPLYDPHSRLFFNREEWEKIFPSALLDPLVRASRRYAPASDSDPKDDGGRCLYEIPCGDLPLVVAARLSLSFPLLFSCVPVWAVDYEKKHEDRVLRRALLTDGGLCTNFPVHLFDAAHPRWPTFALLLDRRLKPYKKKGAVPSAGLKPCDDGAVFLPLGHLDGRVDNWQDSAPAEVRTGRGLFRLITSMITTTLDWNDRSALRLPHVRNRVIRYALKEGEGQLHIDMDRNTILRMAHEYGPLAARKLIEAFDTRPDSSGQTKPFWRQHLYVRAMSEFRALQQHLRSYSSAVHAERHSTPLHQLLREAQEESPLRNSDGEVRTTDGKVLDKPLTQEQAESLIALSEQIEVLAKALERAGPAINAYEGQPVAELRLRVPI
jgi:predicted acylesterase/phospholipase RssA